MFPFKGYINISTFLVFIVVFIAVISVFQSAAEIENKRFEIPASSASSGGHHLNYHQPANNFRIPLNATNISENKVLHNDSHNLRTLHTDNPYSLKHNMNSEEENKMIFSRNVLTPNATSDPSDINRNRFDYKIKHPTFEAEFSSEFRTPIDLGQRQNETENGDFIKDGDKIAFNHIRIPHHSVISSNNDSAVPFTSEENTHSRTERATSTTDFPSAPQNQDINYPNLHPSLAHLLPVYKPLSQEFESDSLNSHESETFSHKNNQKNIESEFNPLSQTEQSTHRFLNHADSHNISFDSDVSTNVLEIPRITKEFENIKSNENTSRVFKSHSLPDNYFPASHIHPENKPFLHLNNNLQKENAPLAHHPYFPTQNHIINSEHRIHLEESIPYIPPAEIISTTTESHVLTTPDYFSTRRLPNSVANSPRQTSFQTEDGVNSFQISSHQQSHLLPSENKYAKHTILKSDGVLGIGNSMENIQNFTFTTKHPITQTEYKSVTNHRSDIPNQDKDIRLSSPSQTRINPGRSAYSPVSLNDTSDVGIPSYQRRYESVLRDFKPDEIVIDIENIPTHPPTPVTASFQRKVLTTVQPIIRTQSTERVRSDTAIRREQNSGTTWHTFIPTTKQPRRRINGGTRRPAQHQPSFLVQKNHNRQFIKPSHQTNQFDRNRHFIQQPNRNHMRYSGRSSLSPNAQIPAHLNQPQHFSQFNNLPPGISVHPRHPQAPYADMVHSNRPPTMPFVSADETLMKPHRQRHHRKKDRLANSCCRLRGKPNDLQSCCRNGGPCCSRAHRRIQSQGKQCCSTSNVAGQGIPVNQIQPSLRIPNQIQQPRRPVNQIHPSLRTTNQIQPSLRTSNKIQPPIKTLNHIQPSLRASLHSQPSSSSKADGKDRCQKEKMCRTLYESTQQVMVCRNALIEGC